MLSASAGLRFLRIVGSSWARAGRACGGRFFRNREQDLASLGCTKGGALPNPAIVHIAGRRSHRRLQQLARKRAGLPLAEPAFLDAGKSRWSFFHRPSAAAWPHLHPQLRAVHTQYDGGRSAGSGHALAATAGMRFAQTIAVAGRCLPQSLRRPPDPVGLILIPNSNPAGTNTAALQPNRFSSLRGRGA
jgi:hypothetical protein